jgi:hypothetical protein
MSRTSVVALFGYNNTRIYDVIKIKEILSSRYQAQLLLIKEGLTESDTLVTPYCIDHRPEDPRVIESLKKYLTQNSLQLVGCLPFSDRGVIGAAYASKAFGFRKLATRQLCIAL